VIEVFGDSDSNGFGIEGPDYYDCLFSLRRYENCFAGYASLLASAFDADLYLEAWSGKGVVKNAVDFYSESAAPMPSESNLRPHRCDLTHMHSLLE